MRKASHHETSEDDSEPEAKTSLSEAWLAYRKDSRTNKENPNNFYLKLRHRAVRNALRSTAEQCVAEYLQAMRASQTIDLISDSESHSPRRFSPRHAPRKHREPMVPEEEESSEEGEVEGQEDEGEGESKSEVDDESEISSREDQGLVQVALARAEGVLVQDVGVQARSHEGDVLEVVDITQERTEQGSREVITVRQHNSLATYSRAYLEEHHIVALIEYYEKLMYTAPARHHNRNLHNSKLPAPPNPSNRKRGPTLKSPSLPRIKPVGPSEVICTISSQSVDREARKRKKKNSYYCGWQPFDGTESVS